jgi:Xaa-Pro aminopeptidase
MAYAPAHASAAPTGPRVAKLSRLATEMGVAAVVVSDEATARWLGMEVAPEDAIIVSDGESRLVRNPGADGGSSSPDAALAGVLADIGISADQRLGFTSASRGGLPSGRRWFDLTWQLAKLRAVKEPDEIERIAAAATLVTVAHRALRDLCEPGISEVELWNATSAEVECATSSPVETIVDLMVGERTALADRPPSDVRVMAGDTVLFDLAPRRQGYWADSCTTFVCGRPRQAIARRHDAVRAALERGLDKARPGTSTGTIDATVRSRLWEAGLECPHQIGHGVGVAPQEAPWFGRGSASVLAEGMVIALEPGAYANSFGVRLEHLAVIEADGARPLTEHSLSLTQEDF